MNPPIIVPARFQSSRLPGKPLVDLCGVPMIVRTCRQCLKAVPPDTLWVATDDERIRQVCLQYGLQVLMTPDCLTGTDRVAAAADMLHARTCISVQGDEPVFNPADLVKLIQASVALRDRVLNGFCPIEDEQMFRNPSIPKMVMRPRPDNRLLYASRAPIPTSKKLDFSKAWRQVCLYAFPYGALQRFTASAKTPMENIEDIEILRFLELGIDVHMVEMSADSVAVDNQEDVAKVERIIRERGL